MRNYQIFISILLFFFISCDKVEDLSDEASITSFKITQSTEGIQLGEIILSDNTVSIPVKYGRKNFPLRLTTEFTFSSTTQEKMSVDALPLNLNEITFADVYTPYKFYIMSESGVPHLATVQLLDEPNAEITGFSILNHADDNVSISILNNNIRILFKHQINWPLTILPEITKTPEARFKNYTEGSPLVFNQPGEEKQLILVADNGDEKTWNIQIVPSIENSNFELWVNEGTTNVNIDPTPGKGLGWATANNAFVQGTLPVAHNGGKAAQMTTGIQDLDGLGIGKLITAGTIFTGYFKMNISALSNPPAMTYFGIPFITRPQSVTFDAKYIAGNALQQSVKENGKYKIHEIEGVDKGRIWVKLLRWEGEGELSYHEKDVTGLKILGEGELIFDGTNAAFRNWQQHTIPIHYNKSYLSLAPTHICIVMTSSKDGDHFLGAKGSTLTVDNVKINY